MIRASNMLLPVSKSPALTIQSALTATEFYEIYVAFLQRNAPARTRTWDPRLRRPMLYPAELQAQVPQWLT